MFICWVVISYFISILHQVADVKYIQFPFVIYRVAGSMHRDTGHLLQQEAVFICVSTGSADYHPKAEPALRRGSTLSSPC